MRYGCSKDTGGATWIARYPYNDPLRNPPGEDWAENRECVPRGLKAHECFAADPPEVGELMWVDCLIEYQVHICFDALCNGCGWSLLLAWFWIHVQ